MTAQEQVVDQAAEKQNIAPARSEQRNPQTGSAKRVQTICLLLFVCAVAAVWLYKSRIACRFERTDDAYITGHPHIVSSRTDGVVEEVLVDDNDHVTRGQTVVRLDQHDYLVNLEDAEAQLQAADRKVNAASKVILLDTEHAGAQKLTADGSVAVAKASIAHAHHAVLAAREVLAAAKDQVAEQNAQVVRAKLDFDRYTKLVEMGVVSEQQRDNATRDFDMYVNAKKAAEKHVKEADAQLDESYAQTESAQAQLIKASGQEEQALSDQIQIDVAQKEHDVAIAEKRKAEAEVANAKLKLNYCNIYAPTSGKIGKRTIEVGHHINPGEQLVTVIEDYVWVVANYMETQIKDMRPGQRVRITVDGLPDHILEGRVDSFSPGSGSTFSLIPPDNATGNFTKIVQRVPVKIRFVPGSVKGYEDRLAVGMSVITEVDVESNASFSGLASLRKLDDPLKKIMPYFW